MLRALEQTDRAPTERWDPPYCGEIPLVIKANGDWFYQGSLIKRQKLVKLFASVLSRENDDYFLITPAEKVKIQVEDAPFVITQWHWQEGAEPAVMILTSNIGEQVPLAKSHPLLLHHQLPYVDMGKGLLAKVHRNVLYQWAEFAEAEFQSGVTQYLISSAGEKFVIGSDNMSC